MCLNDRAFNKIAVLEKHRDPWASPNCAASSVHQAWPSIVPGRGLWEALGTALAVQQHPLPPAFIVSAPAEYLERAAAGSQGTEIWSWRRVRKKADCAEFCGLGGGKGLRAARADAARPGSTSRPILQLKSPNETLKWRGVGSAGAQCCWLYWVVGRLSAF